MTTRRFIAWSLERFRRHRLVLTTSFGLEGCALIDMYAAHGGPVTVLYIDTGFFFPETYELRDRMVARYPHVRFVDRGTTLTPAGQAAVYGPALWRRDPDRCCRLRKVDPLRAALADVDVWVSAVTRYQSPARAALEPVEWDWGFQVLKLHPLLDWDRSLVWRYVLERDVPHNPLHARGYPSLGCTHCTVPAGIWGAAYSRAGRWNGSEKIECGIHVRQPALVGGSDVR
jgi:phosphoadenosine phosphosulfate reductase